MDLNMIQSRLPFLQNAAQDFWDDFSQSVQIQRIPVGTAVFWEGDVCHSLALLLSGQVRVFKVGESGREITLYRFGQGEGCILTASCIMQGGTFPAIAQVEEEAEAVLIPANKLKDWMQRFDVWREFVLGLLAQRLGHVIATIEEIAFKRMDHRLATFLVERIQERNQILQLTHQEIAVELGTAREVVSRILKDFEMAGMIALSRGNIELLDFVKLKRKTEIL